jgi:hypothetical protein
MGVMENLAAEAEGRLFNRPPECFTEFVGEAMGLLDFLRNRLSGGNNLQCPVCRTAGAQRTGEGRIRCTNRSCPNFDAGLRGRGTLAPAGTTLPAEGSFKPVQPVMIRYRNFAGQDRTFVAEVDSLVRKRNHLVARVEPTGAKIVLARDRIQNLEEVESGLKSKIAPGQPWPTGRERQVLGYHKKHRTSSPLFEKIRAKYPDW